MARLPRYVIPGVPQHIIQRGNNRQVIFGADEDFQFFRDSLVEAALTHQLEIHAYVWMTNHIHLLATPGHESSLGKVFQSVGRKYVQYFNARYERSGTLWEGRYRATVVDSDRYLLTVMRYIELNPVRAGMVAHARDYRWSSYGRNADGQTGANADWLVPHAQYLLLDRNEQARAQAYRQLFKHGIAQQELETIRQNTHKGWALGSERFVEQIEALTGRRGASLGIGRPKGETQP